MTSEIPWRRNQAAVTAATFIGFTGFTLVMPFLPLYFEQLGVRDQGDIAMDTRQGDRFLPTQPVSGAELVAAIDRIEQLAGR